MAQISPGRFLLVNYRNVYLLETAGPKLHPVKLDASVPVWNPTAITRSESDGLYYIANYTGNDVLVVRLDESGQTPILKLQERLTNSKGIIGAEGIDISPDGRYMAVASYDGMSASLFEKQAGAWVYQWTAPNLPGSHGITIVDDDVYVSGQNLIVRIDLKTGVEKKRISATGSVGLKFVTCMDFDEQTGGLIASDTIAGRVMTFDRDLILQAETGANGPGMSNFSMPYCSYRDAENFYVLSTYQDRIVETTTAGSKSINLSDAGWNYSIDLSMWPGASLDNDYLSKAPAIDLMGRATRMSYGSVVMEDGPVLLMPSQNAFLGSGWLFYLVGAIQNDDWTILAANSSPGIVLFNRKTGAVGRKDLKEWNCWPVGRELLCPSHAYSVSELTNGATMFSPAHDLKSMAENTGMDIAELRASMTSSYGKALLRDIDSGASPANAAATYLKTATGLVPIAEYWIANSLASVTA